MFSPRGPLFWWVFKDNSNGKPTQFEGTCLFWWLETQKKKRFRRGISRTAEPAEKKRQFGWISNLDEAKPSHFWGPSKIVADESLRRIWRCPARAGGLRQRRDLADGGAKRLSIFGLDLLRPAFFGIGSTRAGLEYVVWCQGVQNVGMFVL